MPNLSNNCKTESCGYFSCKIKISSRRSLLGVYPHELQSTAGLKFGFLTPSRYSR